MFKRGGFMKQYLNILYNYVNNVSRFTLIVIAFLTCSSVFAQNWFQLGTGTNDDVRALTVYNNTLVAGGSFMSAGGNFAYRIAKWDGSSWAGLGLGFNNDVRAVTVYNGRLIAAGNFTYSGGSAVNRIAKWNGTSWLPLGTGMNGNILALTVYNNELVAAGQFTVAVH